MLQFATTSVIILFGVDNMNMILLAAACYTLCGLSDKYAISKAKLNGSEHTFIMAVPTVIFMTLLFPFIDHEFTFSWQVLIFIVLIMIVVKMLEFKWAQKYLPICQRLS